jgi:hypothetical protein
LPGPLFRLLPSAAPFDPETRSLRISPFEWIIGSEAASIQGNKRGFSLFIRLM